MQSEYIIKFSRTPPDESCCKYFVDVVFRACAVSWKACILLNVQSFNNLVQISLIGDILTSMRRCIIAMCVSFYGFFRIFYFLIELNLFLSQFFGNYKSFYRKICTYLILWVLLSLDW